MLLGQLYYFNKVLDSIKFPLVPEIVPQIELSGLAKQSTENYKGMSSFYIARKIRDLFSKSYALVLDQESLGFASAYWNLLVSPLAKESQTPEPKTEFQSQLIAWQLAEFTISHLPSLLANGRLSVDNEDFAIFYGLRVLSVFSGIQDTFSQKKDISIPEFKSVGEVVEKPEILVLTQDYLSPLFINLNCRYLALPDNAKIALQETQIILSQETTIKLVLVDSEDQILINYLQKHLPTNLLISSVQFRNYSQGAFFDQIVRRTLGVKLT